MRKGLLDAVLVGYWLKPANCKFTPFDFSSGFFLTKILYFLYLLYMISPSKNIISIISIIIQPIGGDFACARF
jgi:hypothetical protein